MTDRDGNRSNPYHLNPKMACEKCVFGTGYHEAFCTTLDEMFKRMAAQVHDLILMIEDQDRTGLFKQGAD